MKLVDVVNNTAVPQTCVYEGKLEVIDANAYVTLTPGLAKAFLDECPGVSVVEDLINVTGDIEFQESGFVWLANMTGNPDVKEKIMIPGAYDKNSRKYTQDEVTNPFFVARTLSREFNLGEEEYREKGGVFARALGYENITIRPYQRVRLPQRMATWFLRRDGNQVSECRGIVIASRAKSSFEPDGHWELNDIKLWCSLLSPGIAGLIKSEGELKNEMDLREEKKLALRRSYFLAVDPKYTLPSRAKFDSLKMSAKGVPQTPDPEDFAGEVPSMNFAVAPKRPGRPRKEA